MNDLSKQASAWRGADPTSLLDRMPDRIHGMLESWAGSDPGRMAIHFEGRDVTYGALWSDACAAAALLETRGVRPGDRVALVAENGPQVIALIFAASIVGAWSVPINARSSGREVSEITGYSGCRIAIFCIDGSDAARDHAQEAGLSETETSIGALAFSETDSSASPEPVHNDKSRDTAVLIFTSGTTGAPKGVMLSHQAIMYMGINMAELRDFTPDDCLFNASPVSHVIGLGTVLFTALAAGASVEIAPKFSADQVIDSIVAGRVTCITGVPTLFTRLLDRAAERGVRLSDGRLRVLGTAGAPLDLGLKSRIETAFGARMYNSYGLSECTPVARSRRPVEGDEVGELQPGIDIRIRRPDGTDVAPGEPGEVWVGGPPRMIGYYRDPEATAAALDAEGRVATGDIGRLDEAGRLYVVGRTKDVIIRSGFNVYPVEVEGVIAEIDGVAMAAVKGFPDDGNEQVVAFVQPEPGRALDMNAMAAHCRERLAPYKRPSQFVISEALPIGETGKIMKQKLILPRKIRASVAAQIGGDHE